MSEPVPTAGSVYSFRTAPFSEFAPPVPGRYAALKVLGISKSYIVVAVLSAIWRRPPSLEDVRDSRILRQHRFASTGQLAVFGMNSEWWTPSELNDLTLIGAIPVHPAETALASGIFERRPGSVYGTLGSANYAAEGEWRWQNDREALVAEVQRVSARQAARAAAQEDRLKTRLRGLTWERLLEETPFERWSPSPPFPPEDFTRRARDAIHQTCRALRTLGAKPPKPAVRKLLRECVEWFNTANDEAGGVIETEEREDVCAVLEEMAYVARQEPLTDEIHEWRTW